MAGARRFRASKIAKRESIQAQPVFSGKWERFHNPKIVNGPSPPILLIDKGFRSHLGKPFLRLGQIWDRNQFFPLGFWANPSQQVVIQRFLQ